MNVNSYFIFFAAVVTPLFVNAESRTSSGSSPAVIVEGQVVTSTPCSLEPASADIGCAQVIVPLQVRATMQSVSNPKLKYSLVSDADGNFRRRMPRGRYRVKLSELWQRSGTTDVLRPVADLRISPSALSVTGKAMSPVLFSVEHKSRISGLK